MQNESRFCYNFHFHYLYYKALFVFLTLFASKLVIFRNLKSQKYFWNFKFFWS